MAQEALESVEAAQKVLKTLLEGFESVREQAALLEMQGQIPPVDRDHMVGVVA